MSICTYILSALTVPVYVALSLSFSSTRNVALIGGYVFICGLRLVSFVDFDRKRGEKQEPKVETLAQVYFWVDVLLSFFCFL